MSGPWVQRVTPALKPNTVLLPISESGYSIDTNQSAGKMLGRSKKEILNPNVLVLTDMTMPNLTGDNLAVEWMKIRPDTRIILCTGYGKKISDKTASEIGIKTFAYKPMVKADLAKTARKVLDRIED
jgi:DNA-binding NtrC family response regulator